MVALLYMLGTARVNGKTMMCLKNDSDISGRSSNDFSWNLAKALALPLVQRRSLNGLAFSVLFYVSLEVINLPFLKIKVDMFVVYSLNSYSHLKQKVYQYLKKK